jgi:hypothetical protein
MIYSIVIGTNETYLVNPKVVLWKDCCYATLKIGKFEFSLDPYQYQTVLDLLEQNIRIRANLDSEILSISNYIHTVEG